MDTTAYQAKNTIRVVTAASLFDGHDAAINIMRRIIQSTGAEVIHLGHNRSVQEVVDCALQEDAQAIAMTSYQGGHVEYFKYMVDRLRAAGAEHIKVFAGGGGTILPQEIEELHAYGVARVYSPDDGREMGLQGMINDLMKQSDFVTPCTHANTLHADVSQRVSTALAQAITMIERGESDGSEWKALGTAESGQPSKARCVLGITGTGGAGKSSLTDEMVRRFLEDFPDLTVGIISVDPSKRKTGGALLGDRIRMNAVHNNRVYMRSFATREANVAMNKNVRASIDVLHAAGFDLIIVETAGIGQSDSQITEVADVSLYVMTPEYGAASQLEKIDMIDYADVIALNKFDKRGAMDALRDVKKQVQRSRGLWDQSPDAMPVYGTIASQFNDPGANRLYSELVTLLQRRCGVSWTSTIHLPVGDSEKIYIIPPERSRYLSEIVEDNKRYDSLVKQQADLARTLYQLNGSIRELERSSSKR